MNGLFPLFFVVVLFQVAVNMLLSDIRLIYNAALDALGKLRRPVEALNVFHAMQAMLLSVQYAQF